MTKLEYAIYFATKAHAGQKRKSEDVDMIYHPFIVGMLLKNYGLRDEVVIAGILHDVVEDTKYTERDIEDIFGLEVKNLVLYASEPDKSLSWEERKKHTIECSRTIPYEAKLIICADKISNLDTLYKDLMEQGEKVWLNLNRGKELQQWYYEELLKSIRENEEDNELFRRYEEILEKIFS
ncbi:MAG: hypothetical protein A2Y22_07770 [Clostridiales bacterium GWD2_32_59]|nr:MAG: hypothetical protein A2Y22_07770 [Clostridiales bacterium GWD2_32_59]